MGTKSNPGTFDCYGKALPDEPVFVLLGRDPAFGVLVLDWAAKRKDLIQRGLRPQSDMVMVEEAEQCAKEGLAWRAANDGKWRQPPHRFDKLPLGE
jgi:hypothetical protein